MQVLLASPRGFCAGVDRAIEIVARALALYGPPVYVLHEIVHNRAVLEDFRGRGVRFVESLEEIPPGSVTIFSAHGVAEEIESKGRARHLRVIDATCPLVTKVHLQAQRYQRERREIVLVGHPGHPEVEGTRGRIDGTVHVLSTVAEVEVLAVTDPEKLAYVTQTTLSVDDTRDVIAALVRRFPKIRGPELSDICYATQNRQNAVQALADKIDLLLVVGSPNSSNSNRLRELGARRGVTSQLIDSEQDLDPDWFRPGLRIGLTAGASAPESLVQRVLERLRALGVEQVTEMEGNRESVVFQLPAELEAGEIARA
ncbi:MAG: 4-hydroxy-3-methylbut-2-enyl diphosphate reductase [Planctomycetes bacterium]|nr:4-hydroxy-3-methylbut-2-enyl diphosphate reductase [Planctomycetota bacterium]